MAMKIRPGEMIRSTRAEPFFSWSASSACLSRGVGELAADFTQEAGAVGNRGAEILGNRLSHIRQRVSHAEVHARTTCGRISENRHVFTGMVGGGPARIGVAAVVGGNHQQIGESEQREEIAERAIKFF